VEVLLELLTGRRRALGLFVAVASFGADRIDWQPDLDGALERARREKRALFVAVNMDGEEANDVIAEGHYRERVVVARARDFVCLVASADAHSPSGACPRFGAVTCADHQRVERQVRARYLGGATRVVAPQHLVVSPEGNVLRRREWALSEDELLLWMEEGLRDLEVERQRDPSVPFDDEGWRRRLGAARSPVKARGLFRELVAIDRSEAQDLLQRRFSEAKDEATRIEILRALGEPGYGRGSRFLLDRLADPSAKVRRHAVVSLERVGDGAATDPLLAAAKREKDEGVLKEIVRASARLAADRADVVDLVSRLAQDRRDLVRGNALVAAADLADREGALSLIRGGLADPSRDVLGCAVIGLALVGEPSDLAALSALESEAPELRFRLLLEVARRRIVSGPGLDVSTELQVALAVFAQDDIPHDGAWPPPPLPGR